jgi:hypothetical protein
MKKGENNETQESKKLIHYVLDKVTGSHSNFKGNDRFYTATGINSRRWAKLYKGELSMTIDELNNLCHYLEIELSTETFDRQLKIKFFKQ